MKPTSVLKPPPELSQHAAEELSATLARIPIVADVRIDWPKQPRDDGYDFVVRARVAGVPHVVVAAVKSAVPPRVAREIAQRLATAHSEAVPGTSVTPILVAPFVSPQAAEVLRAAGIGWLDFEGNCRLALGAAFIEVSTRDARRARSSPARHLVSLFAPKSARVLRLMLQNPRQPWRVEDLSRAPQTRISLGHASNVRRALLDMEWATVDDAGLRLSRPRELLEAWGHAWKLRRPVRSAYHSVLHGAALDQALHAAMHDLRGAPDGSARLLAPGGEFLLASFSAAEHVAPFVRVPSLYLYATRRAFTVLRPRLGLEPAPRGPNVLLEEPRDEGILLDRVGLSGEDAPCRTGDVQTYLDLLREGERGEEAAAHLLESVILPAWKNA